MPKQIQYNPELVYNALSAYALGVKKGAIAEKLNITRYHLNKMIKDFGSIDSEKFKMFCAMAKRDQFREKKVKQPKKNKKTNVGYKPQEEDPLFAEDPYMYVQEEKKAKKSKKQPTKTKKKLLELIQEEDEAELPEDEYQVPILEHQDAYENAQEDEDDENEDDIDEVDLDLLMEDF